jgi:hypothetical protein
MDNLIIEGYHGAYYVPSVDFNAETGVCSLSGESYLEDTLEFYTQLNNWLDKFYAEKKIPLTFEFKLQYYNTSSSKCIVDIMVLLKKYQNKGKQILVKWFYNNASEDADEEIEEVEDFMTETGLKIEIVPFE